MMIEILAIALAATATPAPLTPSGKWVVDYQKDMCLVSRQFGPPTDATIFALKPSVSMENGGQTMFVVTPTTGTGVRRGQAVVTLQPSGEQRELDYVSWIPGGKKFRGYEIPADADFIATLAQSTGIAIVAGKDSFAFATGKVQPVLNALKACNENLFRTWGVDPAAMAVTEKGVEPANWFPPNSYPSEAKRRGATGRSVIVLTVAPAGQPTNCRVVITADPDLDRTSCRLAMRSGRFAKVAGPADRYAILSVRWELWN